MIATVFGEGPWTAKGSESPMSLTPVDLRRRLAFIRYLHHLGNDQAHLPEPQSSASILMFHDAVEAFLLLTGEHFGVPLGEFEKYWQALKVATGVDLPIRQGMKRLNKLRVNLKHYGGRPDQETIDQVRSDTASFFQEATPLVFSLDYATVSMADVISHLRARDLVRQAEHASASGDQIAAMVALADAGEELLDPSPLDSTDIQAPLRFGPTIRLLVPERDMQRVLAPPEADQRRRSTGRYRELARQLAQVSKTVAELQAATRITALGIDFAAYQRFRLLTPHVSDTLGGQRDYLAPQGYTPTPQEVAWCCQFIVTVALRRSAAEAHLTQPSWHTEAGGRLWATIAQGTWHRPALASETETAQ
jgi:hypothetical protein